MAIPSIYVVCDKLDALGELCSGAKSLATSVTAVIFGDETVAASVAGCGADHIVYCPVDAQGAPEDYAKAIAAEVKTQPEAVVMLDNSIRARLLAGKLGALLDTAVLTSVGEMVIEDGKLVCKRMVYGGTAQSSQVFTTAYAVVTLGSGVFEAASFEATSSIRKIEGAPQDTLKRVAMNEKKESSVNLAAAKRIVDVGRGWNAEEDLELCRKLASVLNAEVGCSRPVAENNKWMPKSCYMGVTGVQVKPDVCVVLGVSGQVQHIAGINKSKVIVAVNKDKEAPIFKNADFGLVGDMYKIVPALIEKLS